MTHTPFPATDVAIVGGGIVGCSTALALAESGLRVTVFERGRVASEQSSRAWGFIRQQGRHEAEVPLAAEANRLWGELTARYGAESTHFTRGGILVPAQTEADEERVLSGLEVARQFQLQTRVLTRPQLAALIPELAGDWRCGLYTAGDAHGDPGVSTRTIAAAARAAGVLIHEEQPVLAVETRGGAVAGLRTATGRCEAPVVVLAGGIGTPVLARGMGLHLPIQVIRSSVGHTVAAAPFTEVAVWGPRTAYRPRPDGSFTIGNGYRGVGADYDITLNSLRGLRHFLPAYRQNRRLLRLRLGREFLHQSRAALGGPAAMHPLPEPRPNAAKVAQNLDQFRRLFPHLGPIALQRSWAGRIDLTPDVIPIIDRPDPGRALFVATGFSGHGFALGPAVGRQLAEWITRGRPSLDLAAFRLARFTDGTANRAGQAL